MSGLLRQIAISLSFASAASMRGCCPNCRREAGGALDGSKFACAATTAEGALEQALCRETLDALADKVWLGQHQRPPIYCNAAVHACARNPHEQANVEATLVHPDDLAEVQLARDSVLGGASQRSIEARLACPAGGWRRHRLNFSVLKRDRQVDVYLATATDINDLQQALLLAQESAEQLRLAAASTQHGVYSFDLETRQHAWSAELKAIFGLSADAPALKPCEGKALLPPAAAPRGRAPHHPPGWHGALGLCQG